MTRSHIHTYFQRRKIRLRKLCIFAGEGTRKRGNAFTKCKAVYSKQMHGACGIYQKHDSTETFSYSLCRKPFVPRHMQQRPYDTPKATRRYQLFIPRPERCNKNYAELRLFLSAASTFASNRETAYKRRRSSQIETAYSACNLTPLTSNYYRV